MEEKIDETTLKRISESNKEVLRLETVLVEQMPLKTEGIEMNTDTRFKLYARLSENHYGTIFAHIYRGSKENALKHPLGRITCKKNSSLRASIYTMVGDPDFKHIGNAMHEVAFKLYAQRNCIQLEATHNSHYFHYKNGFRLMSSTLDAGINYYLNLAKVFVQANGQRIESELDNCFLYLPESQIQKKMQALGASFTQTDEALKELAETSQQHDVRLIGEYIMSRAEHALKVVPLNKEERNKLLQDIKEEVEQGKWKPREMPLCRGSDRESYKILGVKNVFEGMTKKEEQALAKSINAMQIL